MKPPTRESSVARVSRCFPPDRAADTSRCSEDLPANSCPFEDDTEASDNAGPGAPLTSSRVKRSAPADSRRTDHHEDPQTREKAKKRSHKRHHHRRQRRDTLTDLWESGDTPASAINLVSGGDEPEEEKRLQAEDTTTTTTTTRTAEAGDHSSSGSVGGESSQNTASLGVDAEQAASGMTVTFANGRQEFCSAEDEKKLRRLIESKVNSEEVYKLWNQIAAQDEYLTNGTKVFEQYRDLSAARCGPHALKRKKALDKMYSVVSGRDRLTCANTTADRERNKVMLEFMNKREEAELRMRTYGTPAGVPPPPLPTLSEFLDDKVAQLKDDDMEYHDGMQQLENTVLQKNTGVPEWRMRGPRKLTPIRYEYSKDLPYSLLNRDPQDEEKARHICNVIMRLACEQGLQAGQTEEHLQETLKVCQQCTYSICRSIRLLNFPLVGCKITAVDRGLEEFAKDQLLEQDPSVAWCFARDVYQRFLLWVDRTATGQSYKADFDRAFGKSVPVFYSHLRHRGFDLRSTAPQHKNTKIYGVLLSPAEPAYTPPAWSNTTSLCNPPVVSSSLPTSVATVHDQPTAK